MPRTYRSLLGGAVGLAALSACIGDPLPKQSQDFPRQSYPEWSLRDPEYRFYPGDTVRIDIRTAPELSGERTLAPDGRLALPMVGEVMAGGMTGSQLQAALEHLYARELLDPALTVTPVKLGSQKIFVGGEVKSPGVFELPGEIDVLQAVVMAGGPTDAGRRTHVVVMRREPGGRMVTRVVDVQNGVAKSSLYDIGPLRRFDVVYVSRKAIADENLFVKQWVRDALPIDFSLFYDVARF